MRRRPASDRGTLRAGDSRSEVERLGRVPAGVIPAFASRLGQHDGVEQLVAWIRGLVGARGVVVVHGDGRVAVRLARVQVEDCNAVAGAGVAARGPYGVFHRIGRRAYESA